MRGVVVDNSLDRLPTQDLMLDGVEEPDEFLTPVALHAAADHRAIQHIQCRKQGRCAVALVVVRRSSAWIWLFSSIDSTTACTSTTHQRSFHARRRVEFNLFLDVELVSNWQIERSSFGHRIYTYPSQDRYESKTYLHLSDMVQAIMAFANMLTHHEPIFTRHLWADHQSILTVTGWIDPETRDWIDHHSRVEELLKQLRDRLKTRY